MDQKDGSMMAMDKPMRRDETQDTCSRSSIRLITLLKAVVLGILGPWCAACIFVGILTGVKHPVEFVGGNVQTAFYPGVWLVSYGIVGFAPIVQELVVRCHESRWDIADPCALVFGVGNYVVNAGFGLSVTAINWKNIPTLASTFIATSGAIGAVLLLVLLTLRIWRLRLRYRERDKNEIPLRTKKNINSKLKIQGAKSPKDYPMVSADATTDTAPRGARPNVASRQVPTLGQETVRDKPMKGSTLVKNSPRRAGEACLYRQERGRQGQGVPEMDRHNMKIRLPTRTLASSSARGQEHRQPNARGRTVYRTRFRLSPAKPGKKTDPHRRTERTYTHRNQVWGIAKAGAGRYPVFGRRGNTSIQKRSRSRSGTRKN
eukprot:gb/GECG01004550.1/.p1 GENE.gb/GECG01004550.1/~~gb/GECG01004550.1/.p1  ORF type:complete len:375 (+),score=14.76 gb/GECG01004550.1/:1-1125(+)